MIQVAFVSPTARKQNADIDGIRATLVRMLDEGQTAEAIELIVDLLRQLKFDNDHLQLRLAKLLHEKFGRRSEKIPVEQLRLFLDELALAGLDSPDGAPATSGAGLAAPGGETLPAPKRPAVRAGRPGRKPLSANLPRERRVLEPEADEKLCAGCGIPKSAMGHDRSEVLEFVPGHFKVIEYARAKYACRKCEEGVTIGPVGARPIEGGLPGFGLMADVLVKKYVEHAPLHRIRQMYRRLGVDLAVSSLANWVAAGAEALDPIAACIRARTLASYVVQTDDTGVTVLDASRDGGSKRGIQWVYIGDGRYVTFHYTPNRSAEGPCEFLAGRVGWVQADAYSGYDRLFTTPGSLMVEVGCWSHTRRYYVDALPKDRRAAVALHLIGQLFEVERTARDQDLDAAGRLELRQRCSRPVAEALGKWIAETWPAAEPKGPLSQALQYTVNQWKALTRFLEDGALQLDNNASERALRQIAVGRKNWMFAGSDEGALRAATIYTVFGTCRLNGVDPWEYTLDVLEKLASGWKQSRIEELLPQEWAAARARKAEEPASPAAATA